MTPDMRVLVVDDERAMRESLAAWLRKEGYQVQCASGGQEALDEMTRGDFDLLLADIKMPGMDGLELLDKVRDQHPLVQVVMVTAYGSIADAVQAMKRGARDYLLKPFDPEQLMVLVAKLAEHQALVSENQTLRQRLADHEHQGWGDLVAEAPAMRRALELLLEVAPTESPVLITGETGSGKEMAARMLHAASSRAFGPFVPINCGAMSEGLLESELFGHERGAFTGAVKARRGRLEMADGGTLFLDEVGEISLKMQVELLRVLEEKSFLRLGGSRTVQSDFRLVAATHRDLASLVRNGDFRQDFYYRVNVISVTIPPLRERPEDIPLLAVHFLERYARETGSKALSMEPEAIAVLAGYHWPGNVRELKNVVERAAVTTKAPVIGAAQLSFLCEGNRAENAPVTLAEMERLHIQRMLEAHGGNVSHSAKALGIDRRTLTRKLARYRRQDAG